MGAPGFEIGYPIGQVPESEFNVEFVQGMANRMVMSYFKYGLVAEAAGKFDFIESLEKRLKLYKEGDPEKGIVAGNTEWLIDAANFAMIEFTYPGHPEAHYHPTDSDESPGRMTVEGEWTAEKNTDV